MAILLLRFYKICRGYSYLVWVIYVKSVLQHAAILQVPSYRCQEALFCLFWQQVSCGLIYYGVTWFAARTKTKWWTGLCFNPGDCVCVLNNDKNRWHLQWISQFLMFHKYPNIVHNYQWIKYFSRLKVLEFLPEWLLAQLINLSCVCTSFQIYSALLPW